MTVKIPLSKDNFYTALGLFFLFLAQVDNRISEYLGGFYDLIMIGGAIASLLFVFMSWVRYFQGKNK